MLKTTNKIINSFLIIGALVISSEASVPNSPGSYLGVSSIDTTSVRISFLDNSDNETGFRILGDGIDVSIPANDETVKRYVYKNITGLTCDKMYQIKVLATNADGNSTFSDSRAFNIQSTFGLECPPPPEVVPAIPGPYLGITPIDQTSVRVGFLDNSNNEWGFLLFGENLNLLLPANDENVNPYVYKTITGLQCNKVYQIQALAFNELGISLPSDSRTFRIHTTFGIECDANQAPLADAGVDKTVVEGITVNLNGSNSSDVDADTLTYLWHLVSKPLGSVATLSDVTLMNPTFVADVNGTYLVELIVNDGQVDSTADSMEVTVLSNTVPPQSPIAIAGGDLTIQEGAIISLNATQSYDPDGTIEKYEWSQYGFTLSDSAIFLLSAFSGTHYITLTVTDDDGLTDTEIITIIVEPSS